MGKHFGACRWVYNQMIEINQKRYYRTGKGIGGYGMQAMLPKLKKQHPWLSEVNSQSLQIVCHNLADSYQRFFKKTGGYPRFKKRRDGGSFTAITNSYIRNRKVRLPKMGLVRFRGGDQPEGSVKRITVSERAGKYYASILIDTPDVAAELIPIETITGIDLGITDLAVTSAGQSFTGPRYYKKAKAKLKAAQKRLSRSQKGSNRRKKARSAVATMYQKISNQRKDTNHKITRILVNESENQAFGVESLAVKNMMANRKLSASIADCGWHQFKAFLKYKAEAVGKQVIEVDRFYPSSKTCSSCGIVNQGLTLSHRVWTCSCGEVHQRDVNAARNIALEAARNVARGANVRLGLALAVGCEA